MGVLKMAQIALYCRKNGGPAAPLPAQLHYFMETTIMLDFGKTRRVYKWHVGQYGQYIYAPILLYFLVLHISFHQEKLAIISNNCKVNIESGTDLFVHGRSLKKLWKSNRLIN